MSKYTVALNIEDIKKFNEIYGGKTVPATKESWDYLMLLISTFKKVAQSVATKTVDAYQTYCDASERAMTVYHSIRYDRPQAGKNDSRGGTPSTPELACWQRDKAESDFRRDLIGPMAAVKVYMSLLDSVRTMYGSYEKVSALSDITMYCLVYGLRLSDPFAHIEDMPPRIEIKVRRMDVGSRITNFAYTCARKGNGTLTFPALTDEEIESMRFVRETSAYDHLIRRYIQESATINCDQDLVECRYVTDMESTSRGTHYYVSPAFGRILTSRYLSWAANNWLVPVAQEYYKGVDPDILAKMIAYGAIVSDNATDLMERSPALLYTGNLYLSDDRLPHYDPATGGFIEPKKTAE